MLRFFGVLASSPLYYFISEKCNLSYTRFLSSIYRKQQPLLKADYSNRFSLLNRIITGQDLKNFSISLVKKLIWQHNSPLPAAWLLIVFDLSTDHWFPGGPFSLLIHLLCWWHCYSHFYCVSISTFRNMSCS